MSKKEREHRNKKYAKLLKKQEMSEKEAKYQKAVRNLK